MFRFKRANLRENSEPEETKHVFSVSFIKIDFQLFIVIISGYAFSEMLNGCVSSHWKEIYFTTGIATRENKILLPKILFSRAFCPKALLSRRSEFWIVSATGNEGACAIWRQGIHWDTKTVWAMWLDPPPTPRNLTHGCPQEDNNHARPIRPRPVEGGGSRKLKPSQNTHQSDQARSHFFFGGCRFLTKVLNPRLVSSEPHGSAFPDCQLLTIRLLWILRNGNSVFYWHVDEKLATL